MLNKLMNFLFGKEPEIFDENGRVRHNLPKEKWDAWNQRYMGGEEFNWRNHTGTRAGARKEGAENPRLKS
ncbi:MAG: hypothetical protein KDD22_03420 [Bdellovibrionales bacterium]|nr:hypothetical protein [Bdellovibrionales bacterium]